jgi:4-hydroxy-4-methyl-2-oxoglutarate aldolase
VVVACFGVIPGMYVFADSSGAVVIPQHQVDEVVELARSIEAEDADSRDQIARERDR